MKKFRKHNRLREYDYTTPAYYFITTCVKDMKTFFGKVRNGKLQLNEYGKITEEKWLDLEKRYKYVELDYYVVMPNHFHGIIIIDNVGTGRVYPPLAGVVPTTQN